MRQWVKFANPDTGRPFLSLGLIRSQERKSECVWGKPPNLSHAYDTSRAPQSANALWRSCNRRSQGDSDRHHARIRSFNGCNAHGKPLVSSDRAPSILPLASSPAFATACLAGRHPLSLIRRNSPSAVSGQTPMPAPAASPTSATTRALRSSLLPSPPLLPSPARHLPAVCPRAPPSSVSRSPVTPSSRCTLALTHPHTNPPYPPFSFSL